jgi:hypothetical protein
MNIRLILAVIFGLLICVGIYYSRKSAHDKYYNSEINGIIDWTTESRQYISVSVNGMEFNIKSNANPLNGKVRFYDIAIKMDSIYKPANSDILKLIHKGKVYLYNGY